MITQNTSTSSPGIFPGASRYVVIKYVPDVWRMEPRNIGIIVWQNGEVRYKFQPLPNVKKLVQNGKLYRDWISAWQEQIDAGKIYDFDKRTYVKKDSDAFIDAIRSTSRENYVVGDSVVIANSANDLDRLCDEMFEQMVSTIRDLRKPRVAGRRAKKRFNLLAKQSGLDDHPLNKSPFKVSCRIQGTDAVEEYAFDRALENGHIIDVFSTVALPLEATKMQGVHDLAWRFKNLAAAKNLSPSQCHSIILQDENTIDNPQANVAVLVLKGVSDVLDISDEQKAMESLVNIAAK